MLRWLKKHARLAPETGGNEEVRCCLLVLAESDADPAIRTFEAAQLARLAFSKNNALKKGGMRGVSHLQGFLFHSLSFHLFLAALMEAMQRSRSCLVSWRSSVCSTVLSRSHIYGDFELLLPCSLLEHKKCKERFDRDHCFDPSGYVRVQGRGSHRRCP